MKGRLDVGDPRRWWENTLIQLNAVPLSLQSPHIAKIFDLPAIHQDPFDRAYIAQATVEGLVLLTTDETVRRYESEEFRVLT